MPLVSIGLPVHNAARYLREALDSLLCHDYPTLDLIVSDNASTDATEQICREYAQRDQRVVYERTAANMGAVWNFNRVFELARGEYFMWAAFDDLRDRRYVSTCVSALKSRPDAVLCTTDVVFIDEAGQKLEVPQSVYGYRPTGRTARERLRQVAQSPLDVDFYGLARTDALRPTRRSVLTWGFDVVIVLELCLRGPVLLVPEPLFYYRRFGEKTQADLAAGLSGTAPAQSVAVCWSCLAVELLHSIWLAPAGTLGKLLLTYEFLLRYCALNLAIGAGIRIDLTRSIRGAGRDRNWGRWAALIGIGILVYPIHSRLGRSLYRGFRRLRSVF
jgi:glycosyltransferase involved in cell wall biosynthesis